MQTVVRLIGTVQSGGRVEVFSPQLPAGKTAEVIVLFSRENTDVRRSVTDILAEAPGHLAFQTPEEVDAYIQEERNTWGGWP